MDKPVLYMKVWTRHFLLLFPKAGPNITKKRLNQKTCLSRRFDLWFLFLLRLPMERERKKFCLFGTFFCCGRKVKGKVECGVAEKRKKERQKTFFSSPSPFQAGTSGQWEDSSPPPSNSKEPEKGARFPTWYGILHTKKGKKCINNIPKRHSNRGNFC